MATALKLKSDIKKLKAAINSKATPKNFVPKLKSQLEKAETELAYVKSGGKPKRSSAPKTEKTLTALQKLVQKKKFSVYKGAGVDLKKDAGEGAMKTGRRVSKGLKSNQWGDKSSNKGNVYYEYRPNRLDVKQPKKNQTYPKLEKGGYAEGGKLESGVYRVGKPMKVSPNLYEKKIVEIFDNGDIATASDYARKISDFKLQKYKMISKEKLDAQYKMASGGSVKGSESVPYIVWVSKDGDKREFHGEYKSKRAADMAMNKLWDSGEYKGMGNKPKKMYEKDGFYAKGGYMEHGGEVKFEIDDVVYNKRTNTIGIVRMEDERGETKTDADGNVNTSELEYYNPMNYPNQKDAKVAPSTAKEIDQRMLYQPFKPREMGGYMEKGGMLVHGFKDGDNILEIYKGYGIVENNNNGVIEVLNPNLGTRFIIDLDDSKSSGMRTSMGMSKAQQIESAKKYIDYLNEKLEDGGMMAAGGEMHRSSEKYAEGGKTKNFSEKEFKDILDEALEHFYMGLNKIDLAMRYLEVKGQSGLKNPFAAKIGLLNLKESIEKIEEYTSK